MGDATSREEFSLGCNAVLIHDKSCPNGISASLLACSLRYKHSQAKVTAEAECERAAYWF